jgi:hypothetical protein
MLDMHAQMYMISDFFSHKSIIYYSIPDKLVTVISNL